MAKVIAIVNQKGGVAKSTSCVNLGIGLVKKGYKVLAIDFDPQGSLTESLGYQNPDELEITVATILHCEMNGLELPEGYGILHHEEGMDILPANIELSGVEVSLVNVMSREYVLKQFIKTVSPEYDYILIDNMPSLGMLTVNALAAADSVIIPVMAHYLPVKGLEDLEKNILPYRRERFWEKFLVYCIAALAMFGTNRLESSILNMVMIPVIYMIASMVVFRGNIWKKLVTVCCYYVLAIIPEFLFAALTNAYGVTGASEGFRTETEKTLALLLMSTMTFLFIKCINQVTRKRDYLTIENKTFTVLLMLPTATIVMLGCMFYSHTSFEGMNRVMVPVGASLLLMTNIFIFTVFDRFVEKSEEVKKMDRLYQKSRAEIANLQYMNKVNEDNRAFLHDINKFICTVAGLIEEGENQEVKDIMEHLGVRIQNLQKSVYCEHPILNSILCERKFLAESKDISYRITLGNDLRLDFLEELDLIAIVGNLLDNALEAAEKTEDGRYVECRMYMGNAGHFLVMEFCNGYVVPLLKDKDRYISTKRDADSHGIGLHMVGKLVKKYAGIMRVEAGEREFSVKLIFTIK